MKMRRNPLLRFLPLIPKKDSEKGIITPTREIIQLKIHPRSHKKKAVKGVFTEFEQRASVRRKSGVYCIFDKNDDFFPKEIKLLKVTLYLATTPPSFIIFKIRNK